MERISIVGLDGSGKSSSLEIIVAQHFKSASVQADFWKMPKYSPGLWKVEHVPTGRRIIALLDRATLFGDRFSSKLLAGAVYGIVMGLCSHPFNYFLEVRHQPELIIRERDPAIDGAVYSQYYFAYASCRLSASQRLWIITHVLQHSLPQKVIYLDVEPDVAMDRIRKSLGEKAWIRRKNKPHIHENPAALRQLRRAYYEVLEAAAARGTAVVELDATHSSPEELAAGVYSHILPSLQLPGGTGYGLGRNGRGAKEVLVVK